MNWKSVAKLTCSKAGAESEARHRREEGVSKHWTFEDADEQLLRASIERGACVELPLEEVSISCSEYDLLSLELATRSATAEEVIRLLGHEDSCRLAHSEAVRERELCLSSSSSAEELMARIRDALAQRRR